MSFKLYGVEDRLGPAALGPAAAPFDVFFVVADEAFLVDSFLGDFYK